MGISRWTRVNKRCGVLRGGTGREGLSIRYE